ncbi:MAG: hypothetical protein NVS3B10_25670 [Polyangiales bacterium]
MRDTTPITPLSLREVTDGRAYGGKAAQLGEALRAGLPVPDGVALPVAWVTRFVASGVGREELAAVGAAVGYPLAVRSSAIGEDAAEASFAGQYGTVLNVVDADGIAAAVASVHASGASSSVDAYRARVDDAARSAPAEQGVGVVVQRMVVPRVAGVMFSADPVSGADDVLIEASWGLGEAVVAGLVIPDRYRIGRQGPDGTIIESIAGVKDVRIDARASGGTVEAAPTEEDAHRLCLTAEEALALFRLLKLCEDVYGGPRDVEWCFVGSLPVLLQCRPITTRVTR